MTHSIAFHSYKGGTGKTTIASNLSAYLTNLGYTVCLLDFDVYSPSLHTYFDLAPKKWINDFIYEETGVEDILVDVTDVINKGNHNYNATDYEVRSNLALDNLDIKKDALGKLYVGLSNYKKEEIYRLEISGNNPKKHLFEKLLNLREQIIKKYKPDFIIIDTSPGIRFWSLNALALADVLFLTLKMGDIDIDGTKKMASEIYNSFKKYGSKSFLVWNRIGGYCTPPTLHLHQDMSTSNTNQKNQNLMDTHNPIEKKGVDQSNDTTMEDLFSEEIGIKVISTIPCYCDIQFSRKEFLTSTNHLTHPFSIEIRLLAKALYQELSKDE